MVGKNTRFVVSDLSEVGQFEIIVSQENTPGEPEIRMDRSSVYSVSPVRYCSTCYTIPKRLQATKVYLYPAAELFIKNSLVAV